MNRRDKFESDARSGVKTARPAVDLPAGPIWRAKPATPATQTIRPQSPRRSAVIRPQPRQVGGQQVRMDQPVSPLPSDKKTSKLEHYVQWLNDRQAALEVDNQLARDTMDLIGESLRIDAADSKFTQTDHSTEVTEPDPQAKSPKRYSSLMGSPAAIDEFFQPEVTGITPITEVPPSNRVIVEIDKSKFDAMQAAHLKGAVDSNPPVAPTLEQTLASRHSQSETPVTKQSLPLVRFDQPQESEISAAHVPFDQATLDENERKYQADKRAEKLLQEQWLEQQQLEQRQLEQRTQQAESDQVSTASMEPFSEVAFDEKTAQVVATISAAIASVVNEQSEEKMRKEAERLLGEAGKLSVPGIAAEFEADEIVSDEMLDDIIRQRFHQSAEPHAGHSVKELLEAKISSHQRIAGVPQAVPIATALEDIEDAPVAMPVTSIAAFASSQPDQGTGSVVDLIEQSQRQEEAETDDQNGSRLGEIPMELAAWDVEDFRWPVVSNQMIVTGGNSIRDLFSATVTQFSTLPRRIAVCGVGRAQGTTSIAISVARWAVASGLRTLLVDADVASPALSNRLGMSSNMTWLNGVNSELPISELIIRSKKSNLCVMPLASSVTRVTWPRFIFDNLGELLEPIGHAFDLILVDVGPASQLLDELSSPERLIEGVMMVTDPSEEKKVETFKTRLAAFGITSIIQAANRVPLASTNVA